MHRAILDRDPVYLQEGRHVAAQIGDKLLEPDTAEYVSGDIDHITIYQSPSSHIDLRCTQDMDFQAGEQLILQPIDTDAYALIGMKSGKEVEFRK